MGFLLPVVLEVLRLSAVVTPTTAQRRRDNQTDQQLSASRIKACP